MASLNKVQLIGFTGRAPEMRYTPEGTATASVQLATSETWKDRESGNKREHTEWHRLVFFGRLADVIGQYGKTGQMLYVEGKLRTRKWTDKDSGIDRYTTEIVVAEFKFLRDSQQENSGGAAESESGDIAQAAAKPEGKARHSSKTKPAANSAVQEEADVPF